MKPLADALHADSPHPSSAQELQTFGRFVGSWDLVWHGLGPDGHAATARGELHFGWVLGGRAVQDVWIVPGPGEAGHGTAPSGFIGSTLRFYDPVLGAWRSTWVEPVNGRVRKFIGRERGDEIELISLDGAPLLRWRFTAVASDSFTWIGEHSVDEGRTWMEEERMFATRRPEG
jgi:hypothetical protein